MIKFAFPTRSMSSSTCICEASNMNRPVKLNLTYDSPHTIVTLPISLWYHNYGGRPFTTGRLNNFTPFHFLKLPFYRIPIGMRHPVRRLRAIGMDPMLIQSRFSRLVAKYLCKPPQQLLKLLLLSAIQPLQPAMTADNYLIDYKSDRYDCHLMV